jgi:hypothetical protein
MILLRLNKKSAEDFYKKVIPDYLRIKWSLYGTPSTLECLLNRKDKS